MDPVPHTAPQRHALSSSAQPFTPSFMRGAPMPPPPPLIDACVGPAAATGVGGAGARKSGHTTTRHEASYGCGSTAYTNRNNAASRGGRQSGRGGGRQCGSRRQNRQAAAQVQAQSQRAVTAALTGAAFRGLLAGMADEDVDGLMQCMPPEVQQLYDTHMTHYSRRGQGGRRASGNLRGCDGSHQQQQLRDSDVMAAALATFNNLTQEQLALLETFLFQMNDEDEIGAYRAREEGGEHEMYDGNGGLHDGLFLNADDGLGAEEEAWLIEQMIASDVAMRGDDSRSRDAPQS